MRIRWQRSLALFLLGVLAAAPIGAETPHIVFVLADDMGWGDARCYNPDSAIPTPHMDRLASEGRRFTDAHSSGAVCTPSRYGFITGRYFWRIDRTIQGLNGYGAAIIETDRPTLPRTMKEQGYHTVMLGKWHLGLTEEVPADFSGKMVPNPTTYGFDYYFGLAASLDFPPYCWVENDEAVVKPTDQIKGTERGQPRFWRSGAIAPGFKLEDVLPTLTEKAVKTLADHAPKKDDEPLFLYVPLPSPHTPCLPDEEARGKSNAGDYGDYVWQVDRSVGDILKALDEIGYTENTLFILSSDNGGLQTWIPEEYQHHKTNGPWRGQKADAYEGGHRVPFYVRWPGHVEAGTVSDELIGINDLYATFAALTGAELSAGAAPDSMNILDAFKGKTSPRETFVTQSSARLTAIRHGHWKLIDGLGSGGFGWNPKEHQPTEDGPKGQLYNLKEDPAEELNLWDINPIKRDELLALLEAERNRA
jgi:arylsulfatase A-like enzyme